MTSIWIELFGSSQRQRCVVCMDASTAREAGLERVPSFCASRECQACDEFRRAAMERCPPGLFTDIYAMERFDLLRHDEVGPLRALEPWLRHIRGAVEMLRCWDAGDESARLALLDFLKENGHENLADVCESYTF